ncbi:D-glycero-beta-D-manno-heptose 1-phosphate adenylyltransferase [Pedobacter metabolipauper]|uniref:D-glycero-beta-D-manno-heptose 1-phosphate adenylyltransferase n=1 Tax=Pedobacter metabolipauper TaxID=425513 RepID=A0A4R6STQ9_9SPHI|nr:D-glycero-beta-D-manno-heptose 1-phosphate adenylyltransferase [Pedobacter metabolipauper]TDQ08346.1 rfaE bifunctional protein nucleotidyltransferase chain/domain [Pedobacter metabolipauper]
MAKDTHQSLTQKLIPKDEIAAKSAEWRLEGKKIVFTNGCFDLIHPGHIAYLTEAASLGDVLVIGVNTDQSVKKLKGEHRPINNEFSRTQLLSAMFFVDAVVLFNEDTPLELINSVEPDVLVKGGDYRIETIVGASETLQRGAEVKVLDFLPGYSSTAIIEKIKNY